jgi:predicted aspartyl protease
MSTAYTFPHDTIVNRILIPCIIDKPKTGTPVSGTVLALWDTGATTTCISEKLVQKLGLAPDDIMDLKMADSSIHTSNVYSVQITMGKFTIPFIRVCDLPMINTGHDVIIGMDVMNRGDLSITNYQGKTVLSFREPSLAKIDYVDELERYKKMYSGRVKSGNHLCPCGSKKQWKNCHGKER